MQQEVCLLCEDSLEGIFTGVYEAYRRKLPPLQTHVQAGEVENYRLFMQYVEIPSEPEKAVKVMRTLQSRFGEEAYSALCAAAAAKDERKADAIYHLIVKGLSCKNPKQIMGDLADDAVRTVFELNRSVSNEAHHLIEFLRFEELKEGILFARIGPKHDVLVYLGPHFADRLPLEDFVIYDEIREQLLLHPKGEEWYIRRIAKQFAPGLTKADTLELAKPDASSMPNLNASGLALKSDTPLITREWLKYSDEEQIYRELFRHFRHKIAIKERTNKALQRQHMPLKYQTYMPEIHENGKGKQGTL